MSSVRYGSVCSGIEAASVAWHHLGWTAAWLAEIEKAPSAMLGHHYPTVPNLCDMRQLPMLIAGGLVEAPDILVGGTPCQAFSVAGLRNSLGDDRGQLSITYIHTLDAIDAARRASGKRPAIAVWENVPGVLNTHDNAFGCFISGLAGLDETIVLKWPRNGLVVGGRRRVAWATLDAQYFGVPQRRRRVFVIAVDAQSVADSPDLCPSKILAIGQSLRRDTPTRGSQRQSTSHTVAPSLTSSGRGVERAGETRGQDPVVAQSVCFQQNTRDEVRLIGGEGLLTGALAASAGMKQTNYIATTQYGEIAGSLTARHDSSPCADRGMSVVACAPVSPTVASGQPFSRTGNERVECNAVVVMSTGQAGAEIGIGIGIGTTLNCNHEAPIVAACFSAGQSATAGSIAYHEEESPTLRGGASGTNMTPTLHAGMRVRRLTPEECEILQGFPVGYTDTHPCGKPTPDGPRYKALGNSMAVPVMRWIGMRIKEALDGRNSSKV